MVECGGLDLHELHYSAILEAAIWSGYQQRRRPYSVGFCGKFADCYLKGLRLPVSRFSGHFYGRAISSAVSAISQHHELALGADRRYMVRVLAGKGYQTLHPRSGIRLRVHMGEATYQRGGRRLRSRRRRGYQRCLQPAQSEGAFCVRSAAPVRILRQLHNTQVECHQQRHESGLLAGARLADRHATALRERDADIIADLYKQPRDVSIPEHPV